MVSRGFCPDRCGFVLTGRQPGDQHAPGTGGLQFNARYHLGWTDEQPGPGGVVCRSVDDGDRQGSGAIDNGPVGGAADG
jgi:hypothetical protein